MFPLARLRPLLLLTFVCTAFAVPASAATTTIATNLGQVNHVLVDATHVYWTEVTRTQALIRKLPKGGGAITDLATEPVLHQGQVTSYIHLQLVGDHVFWSRLSSGFVTQWTLRSVPKVGGPVVEVVEVLTAQSPLLEGAWEAAGDEVLVSLIDPDNVGLPDSTRIGAYNPETATWRPVLSSQLRRGASFIIAATDDSAWVRGLTNNDETEIGHISLNTPEPVYTELLHDEVDDRAADEPGATDGTNLFFWTRLFRLSLSRIPVGGGEDAVVTGGTGTGLIVSEGFLYWCKGKNILKRGVAGTANTKHFKGVFSTAALGGLAFDDDFLYVVQKKSRIFSILQVDK